MLYVYIHMPFHADNVPSPVYFKLRHSLDE